MREFQNWLMIKLVPITVIVLLLQNNVSLLILHKNTKTSIIFDNTKRALRELRTMTHHHANCDRNGNELSNPRTMKMVTSVT